MRFKLLSLGVLFGVGLTVLFAAERNALRTQKNKVRVRVSHEDLATKQQPRDPSIGDRAIKLDDLRGSRQEDGVATNAREEVRTKSLVARSSIISSRTHWTIVPKGAILHVPSLYEGRVNGKREGKLIDWHDFLTKNRNWLKLHEVSVAQARGEVPINPDLLKAYESAGLLVVAVCRGGPISVLEPKEEIVDADPAVAAEESAKAQAQAAREVKAIEDLKLRIRNGLLK